MSGEVIAIPLEEVSALEEIAEVAAPDITDAPEIIPEVVPAPKKRGRPKATKAKALPAPPPPAPVPAPPPPAPVAAAPKKAGRPRKPPEQTERVVEQSVTVEDIVRVLKAQEIRSKEMKRELYRQMIRL